MWVLVVMVVFDVIVVNGGIFDGVLSNGVNFVFDCDFEVLVVFMVVFFEMNWFMY